MPCSKHATCIDGPLLWNFVFFAEVQWFSDMCGMTFEKCCEGETQRDVSCETPRFLTDIFLMAQPTCLYGQFGCPKLLPFRPVSGQRQHMSQCVPNIPRLRTRSSRTTPLMALCPLMLPAATTRLALPSSTTTTRGPTRWMDGWMDGHHHTKAEPTALDPKALNPQAQNDRRILVRLRRPPLNTNRPHSGSRKDGPSGRSWRSIRYARRLCI